jgi:hypothetical protein
MAVSTRKPVTRQTNMRSLVNAVDGKEQPYPVYRFGRRRFYEKPKHNPFG